MEIIGILEYSQGLKKRIDDRVLIKPNSVMENEIRASTVVGCIKDTQAINEILEKEGMKERVLEIIT